MAIEINLRDLNRILPLFPFRTIELETRGGWLFFRGRDALHEIEFGTRNYFGRAIDRVTVSRPKLHGRFVSLRGFAKLEVRNGMLGSWDNVRTYDWFDPSPRLPRLSPAKRGGAAYLVRLEAARFKRALDYVLLVPIRKRGLKVYEYLHLCGDRVFFTDGDRVHVTAGFSGFLRDEGFCWHRSGAALLARALQVMPQGGDLELAITLQPHRQLFFEASLVQDENRVTVRSRNRRENPLDLDSVLPSERPSFRTTAPLDQLRQVLNSHLGPVALTHRRAKRREIFVRPQHLLDALYPFKREVTVEFHGPRGPIRVLGDVSEKFALVMPVLPTRKQESMMNG